VGEFKQRMGELSKRHPALGGISGFPHSHLGFTYVNNTVNPRVYVVVGVEDYAGRSGTPISLPVDGKKVDGTDFVTSLRVEGTDSELKQEIEVAYAALILKLKTMK
jgi:hypothetical protein